MNQQANRCMMAAVAAAAAIWNGATARAGDVTWVGAGATTNWTNINNWFGLNRPDNNGLDNVYMDDVVQHTTNTVNQDYWIRQLAFDSEDGRESTWTINQSNGAVLSVDYGIFNSTTKTQTVNVPVRLTNDVSIQNDGDGTQNRGLMNIGAIDLNGKNLSVYASPNGVNLTGSITGVGNVLIENSGPVTLSGSNSWTGWLLIRKGSVTANAGVNLGSTSNRVVFRQRDATSIPTLVRNGSGTISVPISFDSGEGRIETPAGVSVTISSGLDGEDGVGNFGKTGAGTIVLTAPAVKYGQTIVRAGTLQLAADSALSNLGLQVLNGSTLSVNADVAQTVRSLDGFGSIQLGDSTELYIGRTVDPTNTNNGTGTFGGVISGGSTLVVKQGAGTFTLSGNNTYSGITDVRGGVLVANSAALGSSSTGTSTVSVKLGTRLAGGGLINGPVVIDAGATIAPSNVGTPDAGIGSLWAGSLLLRDDAITRLDFNASDIDRINSASTSRINGELQLNQIGSAIPSLGSTRQILSALSARFGVFSRITGMSLSADHSWAITYTATGVFATVATPGNANLDSIVNFDDLLLLASNYNAAQFKTWSDGDFTGDSAVNFDDLLILASKYNQPASGGLGGDWALAQTLIPEPASLAAFVVAIPCLLRRRRR